MFYRVLSFILLALFLSAFLAQGSVYAQLTKNECYKDMCGPGYKPVMQSNGKCACVKSESKDPGTTQTPSTTQGDAGSTSSQQVPR